MPLRFPKLQYPDWLTAVRDLGTILSSLLKDESQPERWSFVSNIGDAVKSTGLPKAPEFDTTEYAYRFTNSASQVIASSFSFPSTFKLEGNPSVIPHIHLYSLTAGSTTTSCKTIWRFRWKWYNPNGIHSASFNTVTITSSSITGARQSFPISIGERTASLSLSVMSIFKYELAKLPGGGNRIYYVDEIHFAARHDTNRGSALPFQKWI
jgi:hypothetical protein